MSIHDQHSPLQRWFYNYVDDENAYFYSSGWVTVVRDGKRWRIEQGYWDSGYINVQYADPRAPTPPVFEYRAPKPEPVKPRFRVPEPPRVDAAPPFSAFTARQLQEMMRSVPSRAQIDLIAAQFTPVFSEPPKPSTRRNQ
jgi:hypothetical protein